ncbi:hypothetical protein KFE25_011803 [Diacronema lutheri]|uniref:Uncharacterized protein n=1 Tax=Diacronema lutheri TaxID=2081491 RepID=A0A8J6C2Z9_DIALT|nr:hypothetical protein KFE25_011803 [Diacronema lutheri]
MAASASEYQPPVARRDVVRLSWSTDVPAGTYQTSHRLSLGVGVYASTRHMRAAGVPADPLTPLSITGKYGADLASTTHSDFPPHALAGLAQRGTAGTAATSTGGVAAALRSDPPALAERQASVALAHFPDLFKAGVAQGARIHAARTMRAASSGVLICGGGGGAGDAAGAHRTQTTSAAAFVAHTDGARLVEAARARRAVSDARRLGDIARGGGLAAFGGGGAHRNGAVTASSAGAFVTTNARFYVAPQGSHRWFTAGPGISTTHSSLQSVAHEEGAHARTPLRTTTGELFAQSEAASGARPPAPFDANRKTTFGVPVAAMDGRGLGRS